MNVPRTISLATAVFLLGIGLAASQTRAQNRSTVEDTSRAAGPIIDVHLHALPLSSFPEEADKAIGYERPESTEAVMRQTVEQLKRYGVETAITSGPPGLVAKYKEVAPDRIVRSLWVPIGVTGDSLRTYLDSLSTWHEQGHSQVIGEVLTQYSGLAPGDPILDPLWSFAEEEGIPVGIHMGPGGPLTTTYRARHGNPLAIEGVLAEYPDLKVYIMHAGYPMLDEMIALLANYPRVRVGIGALPFLIPRAEFHRYLKGLVRAGHADRILFGSDQQIWPQSYEASVEAVENADYLSEEQKQAIFYENAARFFGLDPESADGS